MMIKSLLCIILFIGAYPSFAQFNDSTNYFVHFGSTGIFNRTNETRSYLLNNNVKFSVYRKSFSMNTNNTWIFGENQDAITNNDFSSSLDFNLHKTLKHFYYWGLASYEKSISLKIDHRYQAGLGVGYHIVDRPKAVVILSDGVLHESSALYDTPEAGRDTTYSTFRNSFRLKFRFVIHDIITLDGSDFIQHSLSDRRDYIIRSQTTLSVKLVKWLSFNTSLTYNKLSATSRENLLLTFGLSAEKYF